MLEWNRVLNWSKESVVDSPLEKHEGELGLAKDSVRRP